MEHMQSQLMNGVWVKKMMKRKLLYFIFLSIAMLVFKVVSDGILIDTEHSGKKAVVLL